MDLNTIRTLINQRNQYNEQISKINGYLNQQYEAAFMSGNIEQLRMLSEILSSSKTSVASQQTTPSMQQASQQTAQSPSATTQQTKSIIPAKKQILEVKKEIKKTSQEDANEQHLNTWRENVAQMSRNDLKENKKSIERQIEEYKLAAENADNSSEKTKNLLSAEYYMKCMSILNDQIEVEERKASKHFEAMANAALTRKDIAKNKQSISEAPSAEEISSRNNKTTSDDDSKKSKSKLGSDTKKPKIKLQIEASKSDDGSESNVETPASNIVNDIEGS